eukprot:TRINITY_DN1218_c0_g3_i3.p1 TRINITY_DN1218_c0_g3~~TRINITY_DN1218_c0_g3_i3.p1  ORF type:complete len:442 (-),score=85.80 TRINITY_DN1218_c0_g3_i3:380-1705(-)
MCIRDRTLNPQWDEAFRYQIKTNSSKLLVYLEIWNKNKMANSFLGAVEYQIQALSSFKASTHALQLAQKSGKKSKSMPGKLEFGVGLRQGSNLKGGKTKIRDSTGFLLLHTDWRLAVRHMTDSLTPVALPENAFAGVRLVGTPSRATVVSKVIELYQDVAGKDPHHSYRIRALDISVNMKQSVRRRYDYGTLEIVRFPLLGDSRFLCMDKRVAMRFDEGDPASGKFNALTTISAGGKIPIGTHFAAVTFSVIHSLSLSKKFSMFAENDKIPYVKHNTKFVMPEHVPCQVPMEFLDILVLSMVDELVNEFVNWKEELYRLSELVELLEGLPSDDVRLADAKVRTRLRMVFDVLQEDTKRMRGLRDNRRRKKLYNSLCKRALKWLPKIKGSDAAHANKILLTLQWRDLLCAHEIAQRVVHTHSLTTDDITSKKGFAAFFNVDW